MSGNIKKPEPASPVYRLQYSISEAAKLMNVSKRTFNKWILSGDLPSYKMYGVGINFVKDDELRDFQKKNLVLNDFLSASKLSRN